MRHNQAPHVRRCRRCRHIRCPAGQQINVHHARPIRNVHEVRVAEALPKARHLGIGHNVGARLAADVIVAGDLQHGGGGCGGAAFIRRRIDAVETLRVALELRFAGDAALVHQIAEEEDRMRSRVPERMGVGGGEEAVGIVARERRIGVRVECVAEDLWVGDEQQPRAVAC